MTQNSCNMTFEIISKPISLSYTLREDFASAQSNQDSQVMWKFWFTELYSSPIC